MKLGHRKQSLTVQQVPSHRRGPAWPGTLVNLANLTLLVIACASDYWFSGAEGNVGLWRQCYYGKCGLAAELFLLLKLYTVSHLVRSTRLRPPQN